MITQKQLKDKLSYNAETGVFIWRVSRGKAKKGGIAGSPKSDGGIKIQLKGIMYEAHRLAWFYVHGVWTVEIDHINHIRTDNSIDNLRSVSRADNAQNTSLYKNNKSGCCGVVWNKGKWQSQIRVNNSYIYLGRFIEWWDSVCARKSAERTHGFHPNHGKVFVENEE